MVISWLLNSLSREIGDSVIYYKTAKKLWDISEHRFGRSNGAKLYHLQKEISELVQKTNDIARYFTSLKKLWDELESLNHTICCTYECTCQGKEKLEKSLKDQKLIKFLMGLNDAYAQERGNILMMNPLPTIDHAYSLLLQDENKREVSGELIFIIAVYVDDIFISADDVDEIQQIQAFLHKEFKVKNLGEINYVLGMEILREKHGCIISQRKFTLDLLHEFDCSGPQVGYMLQQITYLMQQICDLFLLFPMDYSSVATDCPSMACSDQPRVEDAIFLTLWSVQTLTDPKVVDGIKMELFEATIIIRKIILEGGLVAVDDGSHSGSGSGAAIGTNDAPLIIFETKIHYDYDHTGCIDFSPDFATCSECSACKCQDCKAKHDEVINAINVLTASVKKMTSNRSFIPSKRISYPYTLLDIKAAKRRRKDTSKASSIIEITKIAMPLSLSSIDVQCARATGEQHEPKKVDVTVEATAEEHNITVNNPLSASKEEEKVEPVSLGEWCFQQQLEVFQNEECLINIIKGFSILAGLHWHLVDEVYIPINYGDEFHWVLAIIILKKRCILVYDSMLQRRRSGPSSEIQKLAKILSTYLDMSGFRTKGIPQQTIGSLNCGPFVAAYIEYLRDGLQVPNDGLDAELLHKRYSALL
ncbi:hypothetical protein T459_23496 [Capsicum annuum]|uniref:Ubiquitin-like protease family profile domain-containing protein n=1 Tax=Capsicum annuum TaxID=4072 RepID=A0A2G2YSV6_CAPAN|nr:hypothetical protein T459_23496 [Capsicum annuum]